LKLIVGDAKLLFFVSDAIVIKFLHDQCQVHPLHPDVIAPSLSATVCTIIGPQTNFSADGRDEYPGLASFDVQFDLGVEKQITSGVFQDE
jgi:hypothetical protein